MKLYKMGFCFTVIGKKIVTFVKGSAFDCRSMMKGPIFASCPHGLSTGKG